MTGEIGSRSAPSAFPNAEPVLGRRRLVRQQRGPRLRRSRCELDCRMRFLRAIALGKNLAGLPTSLSIYKQMGFMLASRAESGVRPMQHISRSQMDLAQKLHD